MDYERIIYETDGRVAVVTINRPEKLNAIDSQTSAELLHAFSGFRDDDALWVAILTGAGDRAFSTGNDLGAAAAAFAAGASAADAFSGMPVGGVPFGGITRNFECDKPIIAAVNGYCLAGGLELALCCDIHVASETAQFGLPEPTRGIMPGAGGTQRLARTIPLGVAMKLLLTGTRIDAAAALQCGLVTDVVPAAELMTKARELADQICECGPLAVRAVKDAALRGLDLSLAEGLALEDEAARRIAQTEDAREGPAAFAEKRKPLYRGR